MTTFHLVRHAAHDWVGRGFAGRLSGVHLNEEGRAQAEALAQRLGSWPVAAVCSSPQPRARETAEPLAKRLGLPVRIEPGFDEIDFGDWTGRTFEEVREHGPAWTRWVDHRASAEPPGGEPFAAVARRAWEALRHLRAGHPEGQVVVVSHGDVIKAALAQSLGLSLDLLERFDIAPASVSTVAMGPDWVRVQSLNAL